VVHCLNFFANIGNLRHIYKLSRDDFKEHFLRLIVYGLIIFAKERSGYHDRLCIDDRRKNVNIIHWLSICYVFLK
jgi:hypothetical protein